MVLDADSSVIVVSNDDEMAEEREYSVTVVSRIEYPTDFTLQTTESFEESFEVVLIVTNPLLVDCEEVQIEPFSLDDMSTFVFG